MICYNKKYKITGEVPWLSENRNLDLGKDLYRERYKQVARANKAQRVPSSAQNCGAVHMRKKSSPR